jgi:small-conductance mechanosensitive channel
MLRLLRLLLLAGGLVLPIIAGGQPAVATGNAEVTTEELEDLVAAIEDDAERQELLTRLKTLIALKKSQETASAANEQTLGGLVIEQVSSHSAALGRQLSALAEALLAIPQGLDTLRTGLQNPETLARWTEAALVLIAVMAAGIVVQGLVRKLLSRPLAAVAWREGDGLLMRLPLLAARLLLILVPPAAFAATAGLLVSFFVADGYARLVTIAAIYGWTIVGAINAISLTLLAPGNVGVRPVRLGEETAQYLHIWVRRVSVVAVTGYFGIQIAGILGLTGPAQSFLYKSIGLILTLLLIMLIMQNRHGVAEIIAGREGAPLRRLRRRLADLWHVLAILYVIAAYLVWVIDMPGGFAYLARASLLSLVAIGIGMAFAGFTIRLIDRAFGLSEEMKARLPALEARVNRYLPIVKSTLQTIIWIVVFLAVLQAWGLDIVNWLGGPTGRGFMARVASITGITLLAIVGWETLSAAIERYLASEGGAHSQRARTLLPLIRKAFLVALIVVVGLTVLSELGINIAPLLAGAGVVGLAIGFGAQTLVRDIITGLFILLEDTISVGDYVTLAGHGGTVETLSIRSIRLRDPAGTVHTIPFSDVTTVINYSREYAYAVVDMGVAYKEDIDHVAQVMEDVGRELRQDPEQGVHILEDLQVQGLDQFGDSAVVIKARIKTAPGMQWGVRRAYNRLLKKRFDAEGIEIPFPQQTIWFAEEPSGTNGETSTAEKPLRQPRTAGEPGESDMSG